MECVWVLRPAGWLCVVGGLDVDEPHGAGESLLLGEQTSSLGNDEDVEYEDDEWNKTKD